MFYGFTWKNIFWSRKWWGRRGDTGAPPAPFSLRLCETVLTSSAKMISLWDFFVFVTKFCISFTQTKKKYVNVIDDICNRMIEFKAKNEIIKMNRNYSNVDEKYGELNTFINTMLITKIPLDMWMWVGTFSQ